MKTSHSAPNQADGKTKMDACGEAHITLAYGSLKFPIQAVVVKDLDCDVLAGMPFMKTNKMSLRYP